MLFPRTVEGDPEAVGALLEYRGDPTRPGTEEVPPLHMARVTGRSDIRQLMAEHGADPDETPPSP